MCITNSRKEANLWYSRSGKKTGTKSTGNCGLEGLKTALNHLLKVVESLGFREELVIEWEDDKRKRAYQYLKRYGFIEYHTFGDQKKAMTALGMRNPEYWEYEENPRGGSGNV